jgi:hypothetical protein
MGLFMVPAACGGYLAKLLQEPMMRHRRAGITAFWLILILAVLACNLPGVATPNAASRERSVTIRHVEGSVTVVDAATGQPRAAQVGDQIVPGTEIKTMPDSRAVLDTDDQTAIVVSADSSLKLDELMGDTDMPITRFFLGTGEAFAFKGETLPEGAIFEFRTPQGRAGIRGSSIGVSSHADMLVLCLEGSCSSGNTGDSETLLSGGQKVGVDQAGNLGNVEPLSEEDIAAAQAALALAQSVGLAPDIYLGGGENGQPSATPTITPTLEPGAPTYTPTATATATTALPNLPTSGGCVVATNDYDAVNIRSKPSLEADILGTMSPFEIYQVIGRNADSSWYQIDGDPSGWASASVIRKAGACNAVPDTYSTPTPTPTVTATATEEGRRAGNNEYPDVAVPYDGKPVSVSGAISYPRGDQHDTIGYHWTDFPGTYSTPSGTQFRISISCSGDGVEYAEIVFDDNSTEPCNEDGYNFVQLMYYDVADSGMFTIQLTGGDNAYVEWFVTLSWYIPVVN